MGKEHRVRAGQPLLQHLQRIQDTLTRQQRDHATLKSALRSPTVPKYDPEFPLDAVDGQMALQDGLPYYYVDGAWRRFTKPRTLLVYFGGVGSEIAAGEVGEAALHFDCIITGWRLLADQVGSIVVDVWKTSYVGYPPTIANTITAADLPTLAGTDKADDTTVTGWTTAVTAGDTFKFHVDSAADVTRVVLTLTLLA